ncbi:MAG: radical SAM protein [Candidatus Hinthialibacter antarcticus]|nr:radical SAM protein [Candidatus Hinthialibacter antarcticus]
MYITKPKLRYLLFYVTSRCNLRCKHCFYLDELNKHDEMSLEEIEKVAKSLYPLNFVRMTGGEPFLRKDLPEVVHAFYEQAGVRRMGLISNGTRPEWAEKAVRRTFELNPDVTLDVGISVDGLEPDHDEIRGLKGSYANAKQTAETLVRLRDEFPNLLTSLVMTVTSKNENSLDEFYDEVSSWGVDRLSVNHVRGKVHETSLLEVSFERYQEFAQRCENYHLEHDRSWKASVQRAKNRVAQNAIAEVVGGDNSRVSCLAGSAIGVLYSDGEVNVCEMLEGELEAVEGIPTPNSALGNIRDVDHDFYRIWHSENAERCRQWIKATNCSCSHECFLTASILFNPKNYPRLAGEWLKLAVSK